VKTRMTDNITPTGIFEIEIMLSHNPDWNHAAANVVAQYQRTEFSTLVASPAGLATLFDNMNRLDFNHDGRADAAYGSAYLGLSSRKAITGPKLQKFQTTPYWFSIALHGTPDSANIGQSNSGGCVHLSAESLRTLITEGLATIGTRVTISDQDAPTVQ